MDQSRLNEFGQVGEPFLRQLERLGWRVLRGDKYDPASTGHESFHGVIIENELRLALKQINPWLEDDQIEDLVYRIQSPQSTQLLKANEEILSVLLELQWSHRNFRNFPFSHQITPAYRFHFVFIPE